MGRKNPRLYIFGQCVEGAEQSARFPLSSSLDEVRKGEIQAMLLRCLPQAASDHRKRPTDMSIQSVTVECSLGKDGEKINGFVRVQRRQLNTGELDELWRHIKSCREQVSA